MQLVATCWTQRAALHLQSSTPAARGRLRESVQISQLGRQDWSAKTLPALQPDRGECHRRYRAVTSVSYVDDSLFTSSPVSSAEPDHIAGFEGGLAQKGRRSGPRQRSAPAQQRHNKQHGGGSRSLRWHVPSCVISAVEQPHVEIRGIALCIVVNCPPSLAAEHGFHVPSYE